MNLRILGKIWKLRIVAKDWFAQDVRRSDLGACDPPEKKGKEILIREHLPDKKFLEIVLHETLHAASFHQFSEEFVTDLARDQAKILWKLFEFKRRNVEP